LLTILIAIITQITAILLFMLLAATPPFYGDAGPDRIPYSTSGDHPSFLSFILKCQASRPWRSLKVF
jgi:hypothetical protein